MYTAPMTKKTTTTTIAVAAATTMAVIVAGDDFLHDGTTRFLGAPANRLPTLDEVIVLDILF